MNSGDISKAKEVAEKLGTVAQGVSYNRPHARKWFDLAQTNIEFGVQDNQCVLLVESPHFNTILRAIEAVLADMPAKDNTFK